MYFVTRYTSRNHQPKSKYQHQLLVVFVCWFVFSVVVLSLLSGQQYALVPAVNNTNDSNEEWHTP